MLEFLLDAIKPGETALVEYDPLSSPELAFRDIVERYFSLGYPILVVDILDTLHIFVEHLRARGLSVPLDAFKVVKEGGRARVGNIVGEVSPGIDFEYHAARYSKAVRRFFTENTGAPKVIIVLGLEKFIYPFQNDVTAVERYFETVERPLTAPGGKINFLFINGAAAKDWILKSFEADKQHVVRLNPGAALLKTEAPVKRFWNVLDGGLTLVEYSPGIPKRLLPLEFLRAVEGKIAVVDVVDMGMIFWKAVETLEDDLKALFDSMEVIKVGGRIEWGVQVMKLDPRSDPPVIVEKISRKLGPFKGTIFIFGIERLPRIHSDSPRLVLGMFDYVSVLLSDRDKHVVCFVNRDLSDPVFLALLEDAATSVLDLSSGALTLRKALRGPSAGTSDS